jgi:hypothetical protein
VTTMPGGSKIIFLAWTGLRPISTYVT